MKINSITIQDLDDKGRVIGVFLKKFKVKPEHDGSMDLFFHNKIHNEIESHRKLSKT